MYPIKPQAINESLKKFNSQPLLRYVNNLRQTADIFTLAGSFLESEKILKWKIH